MKKTILLTMALSCSIASAQSLQTSSVSGTSLANTGFSVPNNKAAVNITQNTDVSTISATGTVACSGGTGAVMNEHMRRFDLNGDYGITDLLDVASLDYGIQTATAASGGTQNIEVRLYEIANADALEYANLTMVGSATVAISDTTSATAINSAVTGTVNGATHDLVVGIYVPNINSDAFWVGSNGGGQIPMPPANQPLITNHTYLYTDGCAMTDIVDLNTLNSGAFANVHVLMVVNGNTRAAVIPPVPSTGSFGVMLMILGMLGLGWFTARRFQ